MTQTAEPQTYHWTKSQYYQMAELGFFDGQRVQLINGEVIAMSPMSSRHAAVVSKLQRALTAAFGPGYYVRNQSTLDIDEISQPEPDVAVVPGDIDDYMDHHPTTALLVAEVSDSSLRHDRTDKAALYARAGIAEYWIVNLKERTIEVNRTPAELDEQQARYGYKVTLRLTIGDTITPLAAPGASINVADVLPQ